MDQQSIERIEKEPPEGEQLTEAANPGALVFDGLVVARAALDSVGQPSWMVRIEKLHSGSHLAHSEEVQLVSPTLEDGGLELALGRRYRVSATPVAGRFFIWRGAVAPLQHQAP